MAKRQFLLPSNEVWGKVIFLHLFVILFTGQVSAPGEGVPALGGGCLVQGDAWPRGCACSRGGCLLLGGTCSPGGCLVETPPRRLLLRAVRILLECILVHDIFSDQQRTEYEAFFRWHAGVLILRKGTWWNSIFNAKAQYVLTAWCHLMTMNCRVKALKLSTAMCNTPDNTLRYFLSVKYKKGLKANSDLYVVHLRRILSPYYV